jgi:hypothetical protein
MEHLTNWCIFVILNFRRYTSSQLNSLLEQLLFS